MSVADRAKMWENGAAAQVQGDAKTESLPAVSMEVVKPTTEVLVSEAPIVERDVAAPALAEEKVIHVKEERVQPVVVRDVLKTEVHQIEQPVLEKELRPVMKHAATLPQQNIEQNNLQPVAAMPVPQSSHIEEQAAVERTQLAPIIQERVQHKIIEQVQPIIYREVVQPHETLVVQPIYERIVEPAVVTHITAAPIVETVTSLPQDTKRSNHAIPIVNPATGQPLSQAN